MADSIFIHKQCGGNLFVNLSKMLLLQSPSLSISPDGISVGVSEIRFNSKATPNFMCASCGEEVSVSSDEVLVKCGICGKLSPCNKTYSSHQIYSLCENCNEMLSGKKEPTENIIKVSKYLFLPTDFKRTLFSEILTKKFSF